MQAVLGARQVVRTSILSTTPNTLIAFTAKAKRNATAEDPEENRDKRAKRHRNSKRARVRALDQV